LLEAVVCTLVLEVRFAASGFDPANPLFLLSPCDGALSRVVFLVAGADIVSMSRDEISDFRLRPGRIRDRGARVGRQPRSFVAQVMKAAAKANGGPLTSGKSPDGGRSSAGSTRTGKGRCSRIGRSQAETDRLKLSAGQRGPGQRMRRVVVKARDQKRARRIFTVQDAGKGQHVLPTKNTTCHFVAIFEKLGVALVARNFKPSAPTMHFRVGLDLQTMEKIR
jgi:hypothetical protein